MTRRKFTNLLSKQISGNISRLEQDELENTIQNDLHLKAVYDEVHSFMQENASHEIDIESQLEKIWYRIGNDEKVIIEEKNVSPVKRLRLPTWTKIAVAAVFILAFSWITYSILPEKELYSEHIGAGDEVLFTVLEDGSKVWLSPHSEIAFNKNFGRNDRKIRLTGKAFFDVAHNPAVPLTVDARKVDVTVKGTAFNIDAFTPDVEVTLLRGLVAVEDNRKSGSPEILLHPNQKVTLRDGKVISNDSIQSVRKTEVQRDSVPVETEWMNRALIFQKQRLCDIARLMERRYQVTIRIENVKLSEQRFTGVIVDESLRQMLDALRQSYPFVYEIKDKQVSIH